MRILTLILVTILLLGCDELDRCLDAGGGWDFENDVCITSDDPAVEAAQTEPVLALQAYQASDGSTIELNNFTERSVLPRQVELSGYAPRGWFFEGSFPVTIMTLEEDLVHEWYAEGPWLEPIDDRGGEFMTGADKIPFTINTQYEPPIEGDRGKIRFSKSVIGDNDTPEWFELMILWP